MSRNKLKPQAPKSEEILPKAELVDFSTALINFVGNDREKHEHLQKHKEAVLIFAKKQLKKQEATQEEWNKVLQKF